MKVKIFTEASRKFGFGHLTRCLSLVQAFAEKQIVSEVCLDTDSTSDFLVGDSPVKKIDWKNIKIDQQVDISIIDSYTCSNEKIFEIFKHSKISVFIDDYNRIDYPDGYIVNPSVKAEKLNYNRPSHKLLLGEKYILLRQPFWDVNPIMPSEKLKKIVVTFGGEDKKNLMLKILPGLVKDFDITAILSPGFKSSDKLINIFKDQVNLIYSPSANEIKNQFATADLIISAGGQTLYELCRLGKPSIAIKIAENQSLNVSGLYEKEFLLNWFNWDDNFLLEKIIESINSHKSQKSRINSYEFGPKIVDGQGPRRVVRFLLDL